jgi:signal transduction histidine kinase
MSPPAVAYRLLLEAIDALPEGIVFLDPEGRYRLWNKSYAEIYHGTADLFRIGARLEDTLRVGVHRGHYPEAVGREEEWLSERLTRLREPSSRHEQRLADGRWIMIEERRTSDGGAIGIRVDITELKLAEAEAREARERAEAASRAKSAFLANMSHEVRTPLNGILGLAQVLLHTPLDARQSEILNSIVSSAACLDRLLSDLLDLSRAESGRLEVRREDFDLRTLTEEAAAFYRSQAAEKGLTLTVHFPDTLRRNVVGDPDRLRQILFNLLGNAVKFTAAGSVRLTVEPFGIDGYRLQVRDTGIGFPAEAAERLFERFEQADSSITRSHGGSGLGLAICRELVELMGGKISAVGAPGQGSTFTVDLPLPAADCP